MTDFDPESRRLYTDDVGPGVRWPGDTAYLLTTDDDLAAPLQEKYAAELAARPKRLATGHLPMITHPDEVAGLTMRTA